MGFFLIDGWDLNKQDKQIKFPRQVLSVSWENVPLELFYQTSCRLIERIGSTWVVCSDTLSGVVNPFEYFSQTTCHHFRGTCSTWKVFRDKRFEHLINNLFPHSRFWRWKWLIDTSWGISFQGKSRLFWLLFPFKVFSVYGKKYSVLLATYFSPLFHLQCYSQVASIFMYISDQSVQHLSLKCLL